MLDEQILTTWLVYVQLFLAVRYVAQAIFGNVPNNQFYKLVIVLFVPVIGYFLMTKKPDEVV